MLIVHKVLIIVISVLCIYDNFYKTTPVKVFVQNPQFSLLAPYNTTKYVVDDVYDQLIDIQNFNFIINPKPCLDYPAGILLIVIVASNPKNIENRMAIRDTWGRSTDSTKVMFLLGESTNVTVAKKIYIESTLHGDIVQGNFVDAYRNMTYKHVMGLKWVSHHCPTAKYVLKTDDDLIVNSHELRYFLARQLSPWGAKGLIICPVLRNRRVERTKNSKWRVLTTEYAEYYYPTYCAGFAIIYSQDVVQKLLTVAQNIPLFWIDDVHITGFCAAKIGVTQTLLGSLVLGKRRSNLLINEGPKAVGLFIFGPYNLTANDIRNIWSIISE